MSRPQRPSLLDCGQLPIAQLARIAMREGVRPRAVYQAHKWFARRLGITARSLLVAAGTPSSEKFWPAFYRGDIWKGKTVFDPFVGGGVMLLEAQRLGANVCGVEIEPVAAAIAKFQTRLRDVPDMSTSLRALFESVGAELAQYYEAEDEAGRKETMLHAFWVQEVNCKDCGQAFDAHPHFRFAWDEAAERQWVACRACSGVVARPLKSKTVTCQCGARTLPDDGHVVKGAISCPRCSTTENLIDYARRTGSVPRFRLFAVETLPNGDAERVPLTQRRIRTSSEFDRLRFRAAERKLKKLLAETPSLIPEGRIPKRNRADNRLLSYGYRDYSQLFNARQRLHLALLGRKIAAISGIIGDALAIAFSDHLTTNNKMCAYAGGWRRLTPLFSIRAYRHIARPVELNPWLRNNGRGTFPNAVRAVVRASKALIEPLEPTRLGTFRVVGDVATGTCDVRCGDAQELSRIASRSIDLVLTDPPYFDYISYSELGHFFAPWLSRLGLVSASRTKGFPTAQLASPARSAEAKQRFAVKLAKAFREIRRVCRDDGRIVFTFQNLDGRGWHAISKAMAQAGVVPMLTFPLYGDSSASLHKHSQSISWDCVMVCRVGTAETKFEVTEAAIFAGRLLAKQWSKDLRKKGLSFTKGDETNVANACAIVEEFAFRLAAHCGTKAVRRA